MTCFDPGKGGTARNSLFVVLLVVFSFCAYLNSLDGEFVFDDSRFYKNPAVQLNTFSLPGFVEATSQLQPSTRPAANATFVLNYLAHQFDVRGYHLTNLAIHIATGIVLYFLLQTTFSMAVFSRKNVLSPDWLAFGATLLWLLHPIQTQAVSYIVQRMTSLSAFFYILSLLLYIRGRLATSFEKRFLLFGGCFLTGLLCLGSKETGIMLPVFLFLYEWYFFQDLKWNWLKKNGLFLLGCVGGIALVTFLIMGGEPLRVFADGYRLRDFTMGERVLTEFRVVLLYLGLLFFPHPDRLSLEHDISLSTSLLSPATTLPSMATVTVLIAGAIMAAPRYRLLSFSLVWFFGNHLVEGTILPLELFFEHRNYLPSMMLFALLVQMLQKLPVRPWSVLLVVTLLSGVSGYWTYTRNFVWQDRVALWRDCVSKAPNLARAHNNLAVALKGRGELGEAITHYQETIRLDPGFVEAYFNLGNVMMLKADLPAAVRYYQQAVQLNPERAILLQSLANALFDSSRFHEAEHYYLATLRIEPGNNAARADLARTRNMIRYLLKREKVDKR